MKAIRFQLAPLGSASKVTQDTLAAALTDPQTVTGGPGFSADNQQCVGVKLCAKQAAD